VQKCPKLEKRKAVEGKKVMGKSGGEGAVVGGSVNSVHAPATLSKRGSGVDAERQAQVAVMETDKQSPVQASSLMEEGKLSAGVADQLSEIT
jgi:hypothetical protein